MMRVASWVVLAVVGGLSLLETWVAVRPGLRPISREAVEEALVVLHREAPRGAELVHSPLLGFPEIKGLGGGLIRPDVSDVGRQRKRAVVVLDRSDVPLRLMGKPDRVIPVGEAVHIALYLGKDSGELILFDLGQLSSVDVSISHGSISFCNKPRPGGGWDCPGHPEWMYVAPRRLQIEGQTELCVWAHPPKAGTLNLDLPPVGTSSVGSFTKLTVRSALDDGAVKTVAGATVVTSVVQGGLHLGRLVRSNHRGWVEQTYAIDPTQTIRLSVSAESDGARHHCLSAQVSESRE